MHNDVLLVLFYNVCIFLSKKNKIFKKHLTILKLTDIIVKSFGEVAELVEGAALEML